MNDARFAPWWAYLVPILATNYLRQVLLPPSEVGDALSVALFVATTAVVALLVTTLYRRLG
jgi:uncharacterized membrane protein YdcZ (DUF606 family)